jgi:hypothetical protein
MMDAQTARVVMEFMKRVELKGAEAMAFTQCMAALEMVATTPVPEAKTTEKP